MASPFLTGRPSSFDTAAYSAIDVLHMAPGAGVGVDTVDVYAVAARFALG
jgi:hypothetical protein